VLTSGAALSAVRKTMALFRQERTLARRFDGVRTLDEIARPRRSPTRSRAVRVGAGALRLAAATRARDEVSTAPAAPPAAVERRRRRQIDRARILSRYALVQEATTSRCWALRARRPAHEVRRAHQALAARLAPASLDPIWSASWAPSWRHPRRARRGGRACWATRACAQRLPGAPARGAAARAEVRVRMPDRPRALFFGSPDFAVPLSRATAGLTDLRGVVSHRIAPRGAARLHAPAVKVAARRAGRAVLAAGEDPHAGLRGDAARAGTGHFRLVATGASAAVAAGIPRLGPWNVHASLLPRLRGPPRSSGRYPREARTGVAVMRMAEGSTRDGAAVRRDHDRRRRHGGDRCRRRLARLGACAGDTLRASAAGAVSLRRARPIRGRRWHRPLRRKTAGWTSRNGARGVGARARRRSLARANQPSSTAKILKLFNRVSCRRSRTRRRHGRVACWRGRQRADRRTAAMARSAFAELQLPGRKRLPAAVVSRAANSCPILFLG